MVKASIIVPVYNTEAYVGKCIESILNQTETDFELILIDDGSSDNSGAICDFYAEKDDRIKVLHKNNGGVSSARNLGLENAKGEMIFFIDSDDTVDNDYIEKLSIQEDEEYVQSGVKILENDYLKPVMTHEEIFSDFNRYWMQSRQQWITLSCFSKRIIDQYRLRFDTSLRMGEDGLFNQVYISKCKKVRRTSYQGYNYNSDNINSASHKFYEDRVEQQKHLLEKLEDQLDDFSMYRIRWDYWHEVLNHYYVKGISVKERRKVSIRKIKKTYSEDCFRKSIPYMRKYGSLDERLKTFFMTYTRNKVYGPMLKVIQILSNIKNKIHG